LFHQIDSESRELWGAINTDSIKLCKGRYNTITPRDDDSQNDFSTIKSTFETAMTCILRHAYMSQ